MRSRCGHQPDRFHGTIFRPKSWSHSGRAGKFAFIHERGLYVPFRKRKIRMVASSVSQTGDIEQRRRCQVFNTLFFARRKRDVRQKKIFFAQRSRFVEKIHGRRSFARRSLRRGWRACPRFRELRTRSTWFKAHLRVK